uniref:Uncharacterized protein n=1 Tax=Timema monikensis TaxID=170555 RepID=A0A7R9EAJ9_9NEOP|nr:unnamed protein product [Timema monikensis]
MDQCTYLTHGIKQHWKPGSRAAATCVSRLEGNVPLGLFKESHEGEGVESPVGRAEQQQVGDCEEGYSLLDGEMEGVVVLRCNISTSPLLYTTYKIFSLPACVRHVNLCGLGVKCMPQEPMFVGSSEASEILTGLGAWSYGVTRNAPACQSSLNYSSLWKLEMMTVRECTHHFKYFLHHVGGHAHTWAFFLLPFLLYFSLCAPS